MGGFRLLSVANNKLAGIFTCPICGTEESGGGWDRGSCLRLRKISSFCSMCNEFVTADLDDVTLAEIKSPRKLRCGYTSPTCRQLYALAAIEGLLSNPSLPQAILEDFKIFETDVDREIAVAAFKIADAMIAAEESEKANGNS